MGFRGIPLSGIPEFLESLEFQENPENPRGSLGPLKSPGFSRNSTKVEFRENHSLFQPLAPPWGCGRDLYPA